MQQVEKKDLEMQLIALNKRFLSEVEKGTNWDELRQLVDEMTLLCKKADLQEGIPMPVVSPEMIDNKRSE